MIAGTVTTLLFDFDGVFRHFDLNVVAEVETEYGLPAGSALQAAFESQDYLEVARGELTKQQWIDRTAELLGSPDAANKILNDTGELDTSMVSLLKSTKSMGYQTALLTNSTCTIYDELTAFGLIGSFDYLFTTHTIGYAKPDIEIYDHVCTTMNVHPEQVFFTDDLPQNIEGAKSYGIRSQLFSSVDQLRQTVEAGL